MGKGIVKETNTLLTLPDELFDHSTIDGYLIAECGSYYGSVKQRWLIVESEKRKQSDLRQWANQDTIVLEKRKAGRFILATNVLDHHQLSNDQLLIEYQAQQSTERGFRFLKDPLLFTSSVFLKSPKRIAALAMNGYGFISSSL